jgi:hypothetical protein
MTIIKRIKYCIRGILTNGWLVNWIQVAEDKEEDRPLTTTAKKPDNLLTHCATISCCYKINLYFEIAYAFGKFSNFRTCCFTETSTQNMLHYFRKTFFLVHTSCPLTARVFTMDSRKNSEYARTLSTTSTKHHFTL